MAKDTHNGSIVNYTQQSGNGTIGGGTIVTIGVYQPGMLFWASPVGDIFTGDSAPMQGADISNWTTADSIDILDMLGTKTTVAYAQPQLGGTIDFTHVHVSLPVAADIAPVH